MNATFAAGNSKSSLEAFILAVGHASKRSANPGARLELNARAATAIWRTLGQVFSPHIHVSSLRANEYPLATAVSNRAFYIVADPRVMLRQAPAD